MVDLNATLGEKLFEVPVGNPYRRYQRTASKITSGGKRKPVNPEGILAASDGECAASTQQSHPSQSGTTLGRS